MATLGTLSATLIVTVTLGSFAAPPLLAEDKAFSSSDRRLAHVFIPNAVASQAVRRAIEGADRRLRGLECQKLFMEFQDGAGQPLQTRLDALHLTAADFLTWVRFAEGEALPLCMQGTDIAAFTQAGSRVVQVCGGVFARQFTTNWRAGEVLIIHELLHTLGLDENPPSSAEISRRVLQRCVTR